MSHQRSCNVKWQQFVIEIGDCQSQMTCGELWRLLDRQPDRGEIENMKGSLDHRY